MRGAAWATVATHFFILCGLLFFTVRTTSVRPINTALTAAVVSCSISGAAAFMVMKQSGYTIWASVPLGGAIYAVCLFGLLSMSGGWSWLSAEGG
jgi:hypothetical protein